MEKAHTTSFVMTWLSRLEGHKMTIGFSLDGLGRYTQKDVADGMWNPTQDAGGLAEGLVQDPRA